MICGHVKFLWDLCQSGSTKAVILPLNFPQVVRHVFSGPVPMAEFGCIGEATQFTCWSVLAVEELVEIAACLQWCCEQTVAELASNLRFVSDLELRGGQEDLAVLEFVCNAAHSINDLD